MPDPNSRLVYSTDGTGSPAAAGARPSRSRSAEASRPGARPPARPVLPADGVVRLLRETKGRGGKSVTIVAGLPGSDRELEAMLKVLKQHCGAGGTREGAHLEIQGDHRERLHAKLSALGHRVKIAGG